MHTIQSRELDKPLDMKSLGTKLLCGLAAFLLIPSLAMAQEGEITGTISDVNTEQSLPGASVLIVESQVGTSADVDGEYTIGGIEPGEKTLRVSFVGYQTVERTVTLEPGETVTADFQLQSTAQDLEEVVVTGVSAETPQAKLSFSVEQVGGGELEEVVGSNPMSALSGKVAGANIISNSGAPGAGTSVRLRGTTSLFGSNEPLFIVDGTILGADQVDLGAFDIKNIEVVKGAAASSLYGSRAQNGVVNITTKRGQGAEIGETQVTVRSEFGVSDLPGSPNPNSATELATNDNNQIVNSDGEPVNWPSGAVSSAGPNGTAFYDTKFSNLNRVDGSSYETRNPFEQFYNAGNSITNFVGVSRNQESTNFRLSFTDTREEGPVQGEVSTDGFKRQNFRLNVDHRLNSDLELSASGTFIQSTNDDPQVLDEQGFPAVFFGLRFTNPLSDLTERGDDGRLNVRADPEGLEENPLYLIEETTRRQNRSRFLGNVSGEYNPVEWLTASGTIAFDRSDRNRSLFFDKDFETIDSDPVTAGETQVRNTFEEELNASTTLTFTETFGEWTTRASTKLQLESSEFSFNEVEANNLAAAGIPDLDNVTGDKQLESIDEEVRSKSGYFSVNADYGDRYIVDALIRRDGSSLFGAEERWQTYGRVSGAYRISEEPFWNIDEISEAKIRYSYGTAGGRPDFSDKFETFAIEDGSFSKATLGNDQLKPALTTEQSFGLELGLLQRVFLNLTYVDSKTEDQIVDVPLEGAIGFSERVENAGTIESETWEASLSADVIRGQDFSLSLGGNFSRIRQEITSLGANPFRTGPQDRFRFGVGDLGEMFGNKWVTSTDELRQMGFDPSLFDKNDDGLMVPVGQGNTAQDGFNGDAGGPCTSEGCWGTSVSTSQGDLGWGQPVQFVNEEGKQIFGIGNSVPNFNANLNTTLRYKGFSLYALISHQNGGDVYNYTKQYSYRDGRAGAQDDSETPQEFKKPTTYYETLYAATGSNNFFVEDATYTKLRELSLSYTFDGSQLTNFFGAANPVERLRVRLVGRNLFTITDYDGIDPEVGDTVGGPGENSDASLFRVDNFNFPNTRTFRGSIELRF